MSWLSIQKMVLMKSVLQLRQLLLSLKTVKLRNGLNPEDVGIESQTLNGLVVADATASLKLIKDALSKNKSDIGEKAANMIALNAGAGIYVAGITKTYAQAVAFAQDIIYGGQALEKMSVLAEFTKTLKQSQAD